MNHLLLKLIVLVQLMYIGSCLHCEACFGRCLCLHPIPVACPPDEVCFAQMSHFGGFIRKGCTTNCSHIGSQCTTCSGEFCNSHEEIKPDPDLVDDCYDQDHEILVHRDHNQSSKAMISAGIILLLVTVLFG